MPLSVATRLGPYEVLGPLGAGGMGEVYLGRDTRLDRTVALKILPAELAASPERRARFEREAKAVSALNHPHICALYDVGREDEIDYLVLEYIEGETLAERLKRGPLPLDQVLRYGIEIAGALDKAHRHGIVHRDLKPGNVMLTPSGAKLLDFGLAKLKAPESKPTAALLSKLQTLERPVAAALTDEGKILGTFQYMAPEQVEGSETDARTDVFGLGVLLYEMASGKRAFDGKTAASAVAAILNHDPTPLTALHLTLPPALDQLVRTCLMKDPNDRLQSAHDVATALRWIQEAPTAPVPRRSSRRERFAWSLMAVAGILAVVAFTRVARESGRHAAPLVSYILPPEGVVSAFQNGIALSPDGKQLAFTAVTTDGNDLLWLRSMETGQARPLADTDGARGPFWSPDGRVVGFFARGKLKKVPSQGGASQILCAIGLATPAVASWGRNGTILFHGQQSLAILQVPASGGTPTEVTRLDATRGDARHWLPQLLPDGRHFLYHVRGREPGLFVGAFAGGAERLPTSSVPGGGLYAAPGYLLWQRDRVLFAQALDRDGSNLASDWVSVAQDVVDEGSFPSATAAAGDLIYASRRGSPQATHLIWKDRSGNALGSFADVTATGTFRLSPDGRRLAVNAQPTPAAERGSGFMTVRGLHRVASAHCRSAAWRGRPTRRGSRTLSQSTANTAPWCAPSWTLGRRNASSIRQTPSVTFRPTGRPTAGGLPSTAS
jgi:serine/threonine protein kinase